MTSEENSGNWHRKALKNIMGTHGLHQEQETTSLSEVRTEEGRLVGRAEATIERRDGRLVAVFNDEGVADHEVVMDENELAQAIERLEVGGYGDSFKANSFRATLPELQAAKGP